MGFKLFEFCMDHAVELVLVLPIVVSWCNIILSN